MGMGSDADGAEPDGRTCAARRAAAADGTWEEVTHVYKFVQIQPPNLHPVFPAQPGGGFGQWIILSPNQPNRCSHSACSSQEQGVSITGGREVTSRC